VDAIESGEEIIQETRRFDEKTGKTFSMRRKEDADDYRYFPDPDLAPIEMSEEALSALEAAVPELPDSRKQRYISAYGLTAYEAEMLTATPDLAGYFEAAAARTAYPKQAASLILTEVFRLLRDEAEDAPIPVSPAHLAALITMTADGKINSSTEKKVLSALWSAGDADPEEYVRVHDLLQISDPALLQPMLDAAVAAHPQVIADYQKGKKNALQALIGQIMAQTHGRADPTVLQQLIDRTIAG
jgi:aspartyl-tRNA(Asn)/glutamyl-tRNA(Gln) amidotransferase subunit B